MSEEATDEVVEGTPASTEQSGAQETNPTQPDTQGDQPTQETSDVSGESGEATGEEATKETEETPNSEESEKTTAGDEDREYFFNGEQVQIDVPDDLKESLSSAGVDVDTVLGELYGKDSDFTLSDDTRKPLDDKFGKPVVDTFLNALKTQNESVLKGAADARKAAEEADNQAMEWSNELVGGEENWTAMESWAADNLEEAQIESFNKAMTSGDKWLQELAIKDMMGKMREAEGDSSASLISGDGNGSDQAGTPLSKDAYLQEMTSPEFRALRGEDRVAAQKQLDARRRAGMKRGI